MREHGSIHRTLTGVGTDCSDPSAVSAPSGFTYDAAGNVTNDGSEYYLYDGEGRLCAAAANWTGSWQYTQYIYDAGGTRVAKGTLSSWPTACAAPGSSFTPASLYLLGQGGEQVTELSGTGTWRHTNVWAGDRLDATYDTKGLHFHLSGPLGSRRVQVGAAGGAAGGIEQTCFSLPFGDALSCVIPSGAPATADDATEHHFTGKERDTESGLDYFGARYYGGSMGRFMSPDFTAEGSDPVPVPSADFDNPQSLNLYSYVHNNPLVNTDPDGHDCVVQSRTSDTTENVSVSAGNCDNVNVGDGQTKTYVPGTITGITVNGGNSIDIGYNSYDGQSSGVTNAASAPIPDNTNLAYNWGNNAQGYQQLGAANKAVNYATAGAAIMYGIPMGAMLGADIAASTAAARSGIIFRLAHGMRIAVGHSQVLAETGAVKNAIAAAIASGAIQKMGGSAFQGVVQVAGTFIRFTGAFTANGVVVSNVMGQALQK